MVQLGVNIDHVATVRQARRGEEPDPVRAVHEAELGGADIITVHLREDRRHINDRDVERVRETVRVKLNLEMAATSEMVAIARRIRPHMCTLVPEGRQEVTTEGGLDVRGGGAGGHDALRACVDALRSSGIVCSAFIDADLEQVRASARAGFQACELHTGPFARAFHEAGGDELFGAGTGAAAGASGGGLAEHQRRIREAGREIDALGLRFNAGHALNYHNVGPIAALPALRELHIGHAIVSRAVFVGLRNAVREMKALIAAASATPGPHQRGNP